MWSGIAVELSNFVKSGRVVVEFERVAVIREVIDVDLLTGHVGE